MKLMSYFSILKICLLTFTSIVEARPLTRVAPKENQNNFKNSKSSLPLEGKVGFNQTSHSQLIRSWMLLAPSVTPEKAKQVLEMPDMEIPGGMFQANRIVESMVAAQKNNQQMVQITSQFLLLLPQISHGSNLLLGSSQSQMTTAALKSAFLAGEILSGRIKDASFISKHLEFMRLAGEFSQRQNLSLAQAMNQAALVIARGNQTEAQKF